MASLSYYPHYTINVQDNSIYRPVVLDKGPLHKPIYFLPAQKGLLNIPQWFNTQVEAEEELGFGTFDIYNKKYHSHAAYYLSESFKFNGAYIVRLAGDTAKEALMILEAHVEDVDVTQYQKDSSGNFLLTEFGERIPVRNAADTADVVEAGISIKWSTRSVLSTTEMNNGVNEEKLHQLEPVTVGNVTTYPIMTFRTTSPGAWGNDVGYELYYSPDSNDRDKLIRQGGLIYNFGPVEIDRTSGVTTPIRSKTGVTESTFVLKKDAVDSMTTLAVGMADILENTYDEDNKLPYTTTVFEKNIATIGERCIAKMEAVAAVDQTKYISADVTVGVSQVTLDDTTGVNVGSVVNCVGIFPVGTTVTAVDAGTPAVPESSRIATTLGADVALADTVITVADTTGVVAGDIVNSPTCTAGQTVVSVSGLDVTISAGADVVGTTGDNIEFRIPAVPAVPAVPVITVDKVSIGAVAGADFLPIYFETSAHASDIDARLAYIEDGFGVNILSARDLDNKPYDLIKVETFVSTGNYVGTQMVDNVVHYLSTGVDGDISPQAIETKIRQYLHGDIYPEIMDELRYPITHLFDVGYSLPTKYSMLNFLMKLQGVKVTCGTHINIGAVDPNSGYSALTDAAGLTEGATSFTLDVALTDPNDLNLKNRVHGPGIPEDTFVESINDTTGLVNINNQITESTAGPVMMRLATATMTTVNTQLEDEALLASLNTRALLMRESIVLGTAACRATIMTQAGQSYDNFKPWISTTLWSASKKAEYQNLQYLNLEPKGRPNSEVTLFHYKKMSWIPHNEKTKERIWDAGGNYCQFCDKDTLFYPSLKSVYPYATSVLVDDFLTDALVYLKHLIATKWTVHVGKSLPFNDLSHIIQTDLDSAAKFMINGKYGVTVDVFETEEDVKMGDRLHITIALDIPGNKRVWDVTIECNRSGYDGGN